MLRYVTLRTVQTETHGSEFVTEIGRKYLLNSLFEKDAEKEKGYEEEEKERQKRNRKKR